MPASTFARSRFENYTYEQGVEEATGGCRYPDAALEFDHTHSQRQLGFAKLANPRRDRATTR